MAPLFLCGALLLLFVIHGVFQPRNFSQQQTGIWKTSHKAPPRHLKNISFGFPDLIADMLWLQYIQDADYCGKKKECQKGWGYQMLLSIHELAPKFRIPMAVGPMNLTILSDDVEGASQLFELAVQSFPNDWPILYRAAYHYIYDVSVPEKAAEYLTRAAANGAPSWLNSLAARMYEKDGQNELAVRTLEEYKKTLTDKEAIDKVDARLRALESGH